MDTEHGAEDWQPAGLPASVMDGEGSRDGDGASHAGWAINRRQGDALVSWSWGRDMGTSEEGSWAPAHPVTCRWLCWCGSLR